MATLEERVAALEARAEVCDLMSHYAGMLYRRQFDEIVPQLWSHTQGASVEEGPFGVYTDRQLQGYFQKRYYVPGAEKTGALTVLSLTDPHLCVSPDGRCVRGLWTAFGSETNVFASAQAPQDAVNADSTLSATIYLTCQQYEVEFVREDGTWKIMHLHIYEVYRTPYEKSWAASAQDRLALDTQRDSVLRFDMGDMPPAAPTTCHWQYSPNCSAPHFPDWEGSEHNG